MICLIQSATVLQPSGSSEHTDVLLTDGRVAQVGTGLAVPDGATVMDGRGKVLLPGLFDSHAHVREPGREDCETVATGMAAALNGGITGMVCMPDTHPPIDNGGMVQSVLDAASKAPRRVDFFVAGCLTRQRLGEELAELGDMQARGAVMVTDDPDAVSGAQIMRRALQYARDLGLLVAAHCDIRELSGPGSMNDGRISYRLGLPGMPACSEEICLARDIRLAQSVRTRIHIQLVTTARGVETVARYKREGMPVTAGVAPHHLVFCDEDVGDYDTNFKVKPPLRTRQDRDALRQAVREGVIDLIATDHSPHTEFEKEREFATAPFGMTGLDTALPLLHDRLLLENLLDWPTLVERFSRAPRRLIGQKPAEIECGQRANCVLFDPAGSTRVTADWIESNSLNTPLLGQTLRGRVEAVFLDRDCFQPATA
ncbi:MAG: dihydroorotase [Verrucomicrobiales bacterium]|nr:dihydroorotase [Verrucomicrobiales bacterium]